MDLDALRAFIAVADTGSFSQAARSVDSALNTIRRKVDDLEAKSGIELLKRAADGVRTTRAGELLAERGRTVLRESLHVIEAVRGIELTQRMLTIEVPLGLPPTLEQVAHRTIRKAVPTARFRVKYNTGRFDPETDAHFVIYLGPSDRRSSSAPPAGRAGTEAGTTTETEWMHSKIARVRVGLAASASYLDSKGTPSSLDELKEHDLLVWEREGRDPLHLPCVSHPDGLEISPVLIAPSANLIRRFARSDEGIALLPTSRFLRFVDEKNPLVRVLEEEVVDHYEIWMAVRGGGPIGKLGQAIARLIKSLYVAPFPS